MTLSTLFFSSVLFRSSQTEQIQTLRSEETDPCSADAAAAVDGLQLCVVEQSLQICPGEVFCHISQLFQDNVDSQEKV